MVDEGADVVVQGVQAAAYHERGPPNQWPSGHGNTLSGRRRVL
eukprot:COSAG02_NODE_7499_length_2984_cov_4.055113_1_plen_42_part_10